MTALLFVAPNDEETCKRAEELLKAAGIPFHTYESDDVSRGVPVLFDGTDRLDGLGYIESYCEWRQTQINQ